MFAATSYTVLRYHVVENISWKHLPLWTGNKATAVGGLVMICLSYIVSRMANPRSWPRYFGLSGFGLSALHTMASLLQFSPETYPQFFDEGTRRLNLSGEASMGFGIICFACYTLAAVVSLPGIKHSISHPAWLRWQRLGAWGLYLALGHVLILGLRGWNLPDLRQWLVPAEWPHLWIFPLPSLTLVCSLFILFTVPYRHFRRRQ